MVDGGWREIGRGAQAVVYYYDGWAYKVFRDGYPEEWIDYELLMQNEISKTSLPVVQYYKTESPNIIRMDFINGISLGERIQKGRYREGVWDLLRLQREIHGTVGVKLPRMNDFAVRHIHQMDAGEREKKKALQYLDELDKGDALLHLDLHFLNVMYAGESYYVIDWINARLGNPIFDFARTYVILQEFTFRMSRQYQRLVVGGGMVDAGEWSKAVYVMALLRLKEHKSDRTLDLLRKLGEEQ